MSITVDLCIADDLSTEELSAEDDVPEPALLESWASASYLDSGPAVASILVTTAEQIQQLNKQYRDIDKVTNVLSFPMQTPVEVDITLLGDIALCAKVIKQEAIEQTKSENAHWAHMVIHGMLHLQGYDHIKDNEADEMERLEIKILNQLGFANPYEEVDT
ncbi:MAG: rRNA maturation RNase YbeY [Gammaproteobacteria bacterium]|nr:MAG: rRNA maturation RNase YbeY [Gammaproteobacteria bacterium]